MHFLYYQMNMSERRKSDIQTTMSNHHQINGEEKRPFKLVI